MSKIINVKVSQSPKQVNTKFGWKTVCNFLNQEPNTPKDQREIVVWRPPNDEELMSLQVGQHLKLLHDGKKYYLVDEPNNPNNSNNGNGTAPTNAVHCVPERSAAHDVHRSANIDTDLGDLDLPEPLSPEQKRALRSLIQERAALMRYCIETMREEVLEKGNYEMHENSIRSLGVSLFIHINKYVP